MALAASEASEVASPGHGGSWGCLFRVRVRVRVRVRARARARARARVRVKVSVRVGVRVRVRVSWGCLRASARSVRCCSHGRPTW